ncbi:MAG: hypothetical protein IT167_08260, partial [Bryobacterales bacterium]|nr:hypothetical protein [Bryobacterales bacterium]
MRRRRILRFDLDGDVADVRDEDGERGAGIGQAPDSARVGDFEVVDQLAGFGKIPGGNGEPGEARRGFHGLKTATSGDHTVAQTDGGDIL